MPTYEYQCENCGYSFEEFQSITAEPLTICPKCQGHVRRLISSGNGFLFKGSGFYITDYRSEGYKKDKQKAEGSSSSSGNNNSKPASSKGTKKEKPLAQNSVKKAGK